MNEPIGMTPSELFQILVVFCGAIITISGAVTIVINLVNKMKMPNKQQDQRLDKLEKDVEKKIEDKIKLCTVQSGQDEERIKQIEHEMSVTNRVILESLQALTAHAIDGNNTVALKKSKEKLDEYLINKI